VITGSTLQQRIALTARLAVLTLGAAVVVVPFLAMLATSLKPSTFVLQTRPQLIPDHPTLRNFADAWSSSDFGRYFFNSLLVAGATTLASVALASMMAFAFARCEFAGKRVMFGLLLAGLMVPAMMLIVPQFLLAKHLLLIDSLAGLVLFYTGASLALNTFLLRSFFEDVPRALEEAMIVDGAGLWSRYWRLVLPLSRPALATTAIFTFLMSWEEFVLALTMINDPAKRTLPIAIALFQGQHTTSWGLVFAASVIAAVPTIALFVAFQRQFVAGIAAGAVKG
jgi:multiple sugar transport system permease protein